MPFCPGCGKKTTKDFCKYCKPIPEIRARSIKLIVCNTCKRYLKEKRWLPYLNLEKIVKGQAMDSIKGEKPLNIKLSSVKVEGKKTELSIGMNFKTFSYDMHCTITARTCDICSARKSQYFEGTLQARNIDTEIMNTIEKYCGEHGFYISKQVKAERGLDINVSDQKKLQQLGYFLHKNFGGILKISPRLFSKDRQSSRNIYRVNVYYEAPGYRKGDVIKVGGRIIHITSIRDKLSGFDLVTGKKISLDMKSREYQILSKHKVTVSKAYPEIEVLDPETYQSTPVINKKSATVGDEVWVAEDNGLFYLV